MSMHEGRRQGAGRPAIASCDGTAKVAFTLAPASG